MNRLDGKYAVVTGGTQGLGAAVARVFAGAGAAGLITCGRNRAKGAALAEEIAKAHGTPVHFVEADLSDASGAETVIAAANDAFGRVDVLVNAAGLTDRGNLLNSTPELFDRMIAVNTRAPFFLMQQAARLMIRDGVAGSIVNIGSVSSRAGQPFLCPYSLSKGALATLTRNAGFALMRNRIRVNQLDIGWMNSDNERAVQEAESGDPGFIDRQAAAMPFGRLLEPDEVARAVAFLASDDSGMMTGSVIQFDQSVWGGYDGQAPMPAAPLAG